MNTQEMKPVLSSNHSILLQAFQKKSGLSDLNYELRERPDGDILIIQLANPTNRFFSILENIISESFPNYSSPPKATLKKRPSKDLLRGPEVKLFARTLSESLTIRRDSFGADFFSRYIHSVSGAENMITSAASHFVLGRRGSGKSTLLLYALHLREKENLPSAWVDMQAYSQRNDTNVIVDIIATILEQASKFAAQEAIANDLLSRFRLLAQSSAESSEKEIKNLLPNTKRLMNIILNSSNDFVIFLDDFHVIDINLQPKLLHFLYSFSKGARVYIKLSAIETFTKFWDAATRTGMESPHDAQQIKLDYNLTIADKACDHICKILDAHAAYCGLPSARSLCSSNDVLNRLVWVAAGVPRDALNIFSQAISKATVRNQSRITVTNINTAASDLINDKLRYIELDSSGALSKTNQILSQIRDFCIKRKKKNAFLVEIKNTDPVYKGILQLIDLRLLHIVHEGFVKEEAGKRHMALILDYGFYIGMRAAKNIDLFNNQTGAPRYKDLRKLPVFSGECK
ncbi:MAG: hypothetical protein AB1656_25610 [Candidatus Omnitrophota bacterium]